MAVDEHPKMVLDHKRLDVGVLVLLVDALNQGPAKAHRLYVLLVSQPEWQDCVASLRSQVFMAIALMAANVG